MRCVEDPASLNGKFTAFDGGDHFVVFGSGLGNSFSVFGPFEYKDDAMSFGELNRGEDDAWEVFVPTESSDLEVGMWYVMSSYDSHIYAGPFSEEIEAQAEIDSNQDWAGGVALRRHPTTMHSRFGSPAQMVGLVVTTSPSGRAVTTLNSCFKTSIILAFLH